VHYGFEVQIDNQPEMSNETAYHATGTLYSETMAMAHPGKPGPEWNTMEMVFVNGVKMTDYTDGDPAPPKKFSFFKEVAVRLLSK
jgi:hypothetical protein